MSAPGLAALNDVIITEAVKVQTNQSSEWVEYG
jgi:hypothetical protein